MDNWQLSTNGSLPGVQIVNSQLSIEPPVATRFAGAPRTYSYGYSSGLAPDSLLLIIIGIDNIYTLIGRKDTCLLFD